MNFYIVRKTLGWIVLFEGLFMLIPLITSIVYWESEFFVFLACMLICAGIGFLLTRGNSKKDTIFAKEGLVIVALSWIVMSLFGALPFIISGVIPNFVDAFFETVSGFTTTGASILSSEQIEAMPKCIAIWRSFTHWIGGMGVLVFIMAFLPLSGARNMYIMKAESPGPTVGKLVPKVRLTAKILYTIYFLMTLTEFVLLLFGKVSPFEALNIAFSTAGTGGFAIRGDSMASTSAYVQVLVAIFMFLFSINFNAYYFIARGRFKEAFFSEVKVFIAIVLLAIAGITLNLCLTGTQGYSVGEAIRHSLFTVTSLISTTGYVTVDYDLWPVFSKTIIIIIMFVGACAGSTGGGIKVSRIMLLFKSSKREVGKLVHPNQVKSVMMDKKTVEEDTIRSILAFMVLYIVIFFISFLVVSIDVDSVESAFTAIVATINNVGPGLGMAGPTESFAFFSPLSKLVMCFDMLAGRLELFPMLALFNPYVWKRERVKKQ